jgi:glutamine synthetase
MNRVDFYILDKNKDFLTVADVFTTDMIDAYIELKREYCAKVARLLTQQNLNFIILYSFATI